MATRTKAARRTSTKTVAGYIAAAPPDTRATLMRLRRTIKAAAPKATEGLSYGIVGFKHNGKRLVYFGCWKTHCAMYGIGSGYIDANAAELNAYGLSNGTIRFTEDKPLPDRLVRKIVKARVAEIERTGDRHAPRASVPRRATI